ncbi:MAG: 50S ribosomal protein L9 [Cyclobacteriaceae bacterium]|nr:50S ribosomal protein L9 [Cyclobacteriaceae bacterium]MCB9236732.1 50S ribosomal protein L9 [Flammeovirgaceae bacterium]MCB0500453.1 50S ribosomal protein L9 [Cyclobacteriaceae bacterium]MCO5272383.1 50S ribosomal protein L9 [Cyclobacteriaceae bacterium]MCW5902011.1 50S ribosomal protein L9 [Cyclobacteriaceae bacterium]
MEIILKQDVQGLGYKNDIVKVKPGYGRNFLIPNGTAIIANSSNKRMVEENIRQAAHKAEKLVQDAKALAEKIGELAIEIGTKAGESGKIFGAITVNQIAEVLKAKGIDIDRKKVILKETPKQLGSYTVTLDLHKEVKHEITVNVVAE